MQVTPLSQLYIIPSETPIPVIAGTLTDISQHKTGVSSMGQWAFQRAKLNDGQTQIQVVFKDRPAVSPALQGRRVYIQSVGGHGLKAKDDFDKRKNTTQRVAWVTGTAVIEVQDGNGQPNAGYNSPVSQFAPGQQPYQQPTQQQNLPQLPYPPTHGSHQPAYTPGPQVTLPPVGQLVQRAEPDLGPKATVGRMGMVYSMCLRSAILAVSRVQENDPVFAVDPEHIKDIATTIFIQTMGKINLDGVPNILLVPTAPVTPPPPPTAQSQAEIEPAPW